jgi:hypothetical protein
MHEAIDGCERHGLAREHLAPFSERLVGGDQHRTALVAGADQFEQHAGFSLILVDVGDAIEDQQVSRARREDVEDALAIRANEGREPAAYSAGW